MKILKLLKIPTELWVNYWFKPTEIFNLAFCRILIVGYQVIYLFNNQVLDRLYEFSTLPEFLYSPLSILQLLFAPFGSDYRPSFTFLGIVFWATILTGILGTIGLLTKISLIVFAVGNILIQSFLYSFRDFHHSEALVMISLSMLALSNAGGVLSIDDLMRRIGRNTRGRKFESFNILDEESVFARWPLLTIQWIFAIIYLDSAMSKLLKAGWDWMNGYTLQYYLWQDGLIWGSSFGIWFAKQHGLAVLASWIAILFELTFFVVLIFPQLVWLYIPLGISFHSGIYLAQRAPFLKYIPSYSVFIPWAAIIKTLSRRQKFSRVKSKPEIIYDGLNLKCIRFITILCYFNWFNRLTFSDLETRWESLKQEYPDISFENYQQTIHVLLPNGSMKKGSLAFHKILYYLSPLSAP